jgi:carotenoid biosynthesis protein
MRGLEPVCFGIVALYVTLRLLAARDRREVVIRLAALALAAWAAEDSVIRAYGFYQYDRATWLLLVDRVPLMVALIWPVVIDSAYALAGGNLRGVFAIVLADAALIEPIAVRTGLWSWNEPGLFGVPIIGMLGWALFAVAACALLRRRIMPLAAPVLTHALLLASWWGLLRWLPAEVPPAGALVVVVAASLAAIGLLLLRPVRVSTRDVLLRAPGAAFFFALLFARPDAMLTVWAIALGAPYLVLLRYAAAWDAGSRRAASHRAHAAQPDRARVGG